MGCINAVHDTGDIRYRSPFGAVPVKSEVKLSIFVESEKTDKVWIRLWNNEKGEKSSKPFLPKTAYGKGPLPLILPVFIGTTLSLSRKTDVFITAEETTRISGRAFWIVALVILFKSRCMKSFPFLLGIVKALCTKSSRIGFIESGKVFNRFHMTKHSIK